MKTMAPRLPRLVTRAALAAVSVGVLAWTPTAVEAQGLTYNKGQSVSPAFEGWTRNEDGSFSLLFGYMNRNWVEELDVPVGPENYISPGAPDQGQPTHFLPRRNRFVFRVPVPPGLRRQLFRAQRVPAGPTLRAALRLALAPRA